MDSSLTLRLDKEIRQRVARIARRNGLSTSDVIRKAIQSWVERQEASGVPHEAVADLIGVVHGVNPKRSVETGKQLTELLKRRRSRL